MTLVIDQQNYTKQTATELTFSKQTGTTATYTGATSTTITYDPQERVDGSFYGTDIYGLGDYETFRPFIIGRVE